MHHAFSKKCVYSVFIVKGIIITLEMLSGEYIFVHIYPLSSIIILKIFKDDLKPI